MGRAFAAGRTRNVTLLCFAATALFALAGCGSSSDIATPTANVPSATAGTAVLAGCAPASTDGSGGPYPAAASSDCTRRKTVEVDIVDDPKTIGGFSPSNVKVSPGTVVVFVWKSSGHNLSPFHTDIEDTGFIYRKTFDKTGEYDFNCQVHPGQNGVIFVR
jgi:plastocyanin